MEKTAGCLLSFAGFIRHILVTSYGSSGLVGAVLTTFRFSESTIFWVLQGCLQVVLWGLTAIHGDANWVLFYTYCLFLVNDVYMVGFSKWVHHKKETQAIVEANKKNM